MTNSQPSVVIFQSEFSEQLLNAFSERNFNTLEVQSSSEITRLIKQEGLNLDAIVVPLRLPKEKSGIAAILELRTESSSTLIPVLAISPSKEKTVIQALYEVGADVVMPAPLDDDLISFQVQSMRRARRAVETYFESRSEDLALQRSFFNAFHLMREGLLLFGPDFNLLFANQNAKTLLGIEDTTPVDVLEEMFRSFLQQHERNTSTSRNLRAQVSKFEALLNRTDNQSFRSMCRVSTLLDYNMEVCGYACAFNDMGEMTQLTLTLLQAQRTRSLCLLTAACSVEALDPATSNSPLISPVIKIEQFLRGHPQFCSLNAVLTSVMEFIDLVISPDITVKVNVSKDPDVSMPGADLFQLLGHLILHAVEFSGRGGETLVQVDPTVPGEGVPVLIIARTKRVTPFLSDDRLSELLQGDLQLASNAENLDKMAVGLSAAQKIASQYRTNIEYRHANDSTMKLRIKLPPSFRRKGGSKKEAE